MLVVLPFALLGGLGVAPAPPVAPPAGKALPPPPSTGENPYNPRARTVHSSYRCRDGTRSITIEYEQIPKGRITSLSRNGKRAPEKVVDRVNAFLAPFSLVSSLYPQCGSVNDSLFVSGTVGRKQTTVWIVWSLDDARLVGSDSR